QAERGAGGVVETVAPAPARVRGPEHRDHREARRERRHRLERDHQGLAAVGDRVYGNHEQRHRERERRVDERLQPRDLAAAVQEAVRHPRHGRVTRFAHGASPSPREPGTAAVAARLRDMFTTHSLSGSKPEQYAQLAEQARALVAGERDRIANAANLSALVYHALPRLNWVGFYFFDGTELVVGPFQGQPACIRIDRKSVV